MNDNDREPETGRLEVCQEIVARDPRHIGDEPKWPFGLARLLDAADHRRDNANDNAGLAMSLESRLRAPRYGLWILRMSLSRSRVHVEETCL